MAMQNHSISLTLEMPGVAQVKSEPSLFFDDVAIPEQMSCGTESPFFVVDQDEDPQKSALLMFEDEENPEYEDYDLEADLNGDYDDEDDEDDDEEGEDFDDEFDDDFEDDLDDDEFDDWEEVEDDELEDFDDWDDDLDDLE